MKVSTDQIVLSCEHGGNRIPAAWRSLFANATDVLQTHRGYDIGALPVARHLAAALSAPLVYSEVSRLLVDLNRSRHHRSLFSDYTRDCDRNRQQKILDEHYFPYRAKVERALRDKLKRHRMVVHLSIHSFTPALNGHVRNADFGLLYDPARNKEKALCTELQKNMQHYGLRVRRNYPYRGNADGLTTSLRTQFAANAYVGIELEINQKLLITQASKTGALITRVFSEYFNNGN